jgi:hypothetical protein
MRNRNRILGVSLILGIIALCGCLGVYFLSSQNLSASPAPTQVEPADVEPTQSFSPTLDGSDGPPPPQPAIPERRRLTVEFPPQIRAGDSDLVRLTLEVDDLGSLTPTAEFGGHEIGGEVVEIPNLYEPITWLPRRGSISLGWR